MLPLALLLLQSSLYREPPVFLVYTQAGMTMPGIENDVECAVWRDGRIVWRVPKPGIRKVKSWWAYRNGTYHVGAVSKDSVAITLARLGRNGIFEAKGWLNVAPDAGFTAVVVRDGSRSVELQSMGDPPDRAPYGWPRAEWTRGVRTYRSAIAEWKRLKPTNEHEINRPDTQRLILLALHGIKK